MNKKIIVARYNEDVSWTKQIDFAEVIIYNKGEDDSPGSVRIPNVGRESGTYLRFIIDNYESISPEGLYCFLQGNPFEHGVSFEDLKNCECPKYFGRQYREPSGGVSNKYFPMGFPGKQFCDMIFLENPFKEEYIDIKYGANFCVYGISIRNRCKEFYQFLNMYAQSINPLEGHIMERIWEYILFDGVKDKVTEYSKIRKAFTAGEAWEGRNLD